MLSVYSDNHLSKLIAETATEMNRKKEQLLLEQLNDFVSRGLIEIQETQPTLVLEQDSNRITVRQSLRLILKDREYVEKLEKENAELKELLAPLKSYLAKGEA